MTRTNESINSGKAFDNRTKGALSAKIRRNCKRIVPVVYVAFLLLPLYFLVNNSFKTEYEIKYQSTPIPMLGTIANYKAVFDDAQSMMALLNTVIYVILNVILSLIAAIPAAYAFSRFSFMGDRHLLFWLLASRMTPPAVVAVPLLQFYTVLQIADTHLAVALAHCLFTVPIAVWILEGFISAVPKELDEAAQIDGYRFPGFFLKILLPVIAPGIGVAAFFCFMFSWAEVLLANWLTTVDAAPFGSIIMRAGIALELVPIGLISAMAVLTIVPGAIMIYFVRRHLASGFAMGQLK